MRAGALYKGIDLNLFVAVSYNTLTQSDYFAVFQKSKAVCEFSCLSSSSMQEFLTACIS